MQFLFQRWLCPTWNRKAELGGLPFHGSAAAATRLEPRNLKHGLAPPPFPASFVPLPPRPAWSGGVTLRRAAVNSPEYKPKVLQENKHLLSRLWCFLLLEGFGAAQKHCKNKTLAQLIGKLRKEMQGELQEDSEVHLSAQFLLTPVVGC